jgi:hypothetical protein
MFGIVNMMLISGTFGTDHRERLLAWSLYLNDVDEGGETEFLYQSMRIKPKMGTFVLWPAFFTHTHRGNPPLSGLKYIATGWVEFCHTQEIQGESEFPNLSEPSNELKNKNIFISIIIITTDDNQSRKKINIHTCSEKCRYFHYQSNGS